MSISLQPKTSPTRLIVEHLQRHGSATVKELEAMLGVTTTAVRQHISTLLDAGYIRRKVVHAGVGRPHHTYTSTEKAREMFACHCDDLALSLLQEVFALEGADRAQQLLDRVGNKLAEQYAKTIRSDGLHERVSEMANALELRGVLTEVSVEPASSAADETFLLKAYNCPYHELAQVHREICAMDEKMMRSALGSDVALESCIMDGQGSCTFKVSKKQ